MSEFNIIRKFAFVDESGDLNLNDEASSYYAVAAVIVSEENKETLYQHAENVRQKHFGNGEIKSSKLSDERRILVLRDLLHEHLKFYAFVINKELIHTDTGLAYKKSAIKHLNGRLYSKLYQAFSSLRVYADEHGRDEFMEGFKTYLNKQIKQDLFEEDALFEFVPSDSNVLVQVADLIAGTVRKAYSGDEGVRDSLSMLKEHSLIIEPWPHPRISDDSLVTSGAESDYDYLVAQQSMNLARGFIEDNEKSDEIETIRQIETLRYLISTFAQTPNEYAYADSIMAFLNENEAEPVGKQYFMTNIIGRLRSKGVIIASSNKGYKIPCTTKEIEEFVSLVDGHVLPYLERLHKAREHLRFSSLGEYEIVCPERHTRLHRCLEAFKDSPEENPSSQP